MSTHCVLVYVHTWNVYSQHQNERNENHSFGFGFAFADWTVGGVLLLFFLLFFFCERSVMCLLLLWLSFVVVFAASNHYCCSVWLCVFRVKTKMFGNILREKKLYVDITWKLTLAHKSSHSTPKHGHRKVSAAASAERDSVRGYIFFSLPLV